MKIYGDSISGNCLKVKWTADFLGLSYDWIETNVLAGESRTPAFLAMNPAGQVPGTARQEMRLRLGARQWRGLSWLRLPGACG